MKRPVIFLLIALFSFPAFLHAEEAKVFGIDIVEYGEYRARELGEGGAEGTSLGYIHIIGDVEHIKTTTNIHGKLGNWFGLRYRVNGEPEREGVVLTVKVIHPETINPETQIRTTIDEWQTRPFIGVESFTGWLFAYDWEIKTGKWTIQLWHQGKKLAEKTFTVYQAI